MSRFVTPFRVGLVVIAGIAAFFVLLSFLNHRKYSDSNTYEVTATFSDASGLGPKSRVQIAGIEVGVVDHIDLTPDARAKATLRIKNEIVLRKDARITKRSASLLGDFLLDVFPGTPDQPRIPNGGEIATVTSQPGIEDVFATLGDVTRQIEAITRSLSDLVTSDQVGSIKEIIKSMTEVADGLNKTITSAGGRLNSILADVQALTGNVRHLANGEQQNVQEILFNIRSFTDQANKVMYALNQIVGSGQGELKDSVASVRQTLEELQKTLKGAEGMIATTQGAVTDTKQVIDRVNNGEGTLGKLVRDDSIADKIDQTMTDVNKLVAPLGRLKTQVDMHEELHWHPGLLGGSATGLHGKGVVQVKLRVRPDKYYGIEVTDDPRGSITHQTVNQTLTPPGDTEVHQQVQQTTVTTDAYKFSAYFAKRYGLATFRLGLIESTAGGGVDLHALNDHLKLSLDAFDWANPDATFPRVRVSGQATFLNYFYLGFGVDDILNHQVIADGNPIVGRDLFATGGIEFTDDDLKSILAVVGVPKP